MKKAKPLPPPGVWVPPGEVKKKWVVSYEAATNILWPSEKYLTTNPCLIICLWNDDSVNSILRQSGILRLTMSSNRNTASQCLIICFVKWRPSVVTSYGLVSSVTKQWSAPYEQSVRRAPHPKSQWFNTLGGRWMLLTPWDSKAMFKHPDSMFDVTLAYNLRQGTSLASTIVR